MQHLLTNLDGVDLHLEYLIKNQIGVLPLPFVGMDKSGTQICDLFERAACMRGYNCPFRHVTLDKAVVCKHWLRGLCKKGDDCEFLHEYDMAKMPECYFFSKFGRCENRDCQYLHIDPNSKVKECPWYARGFCKHGPNCKSRHVRKVMCANWLVGFCPLGSKCKHAHPTFDLPVMEPKMTICHNCRQVGHKSTHCPNNQLDINKLQNGELSGISATGQIQYSDFKMETS